MNITTVPYNITIVDDCSPTPLPKLSSLYDDVRVIRPPKNLKLPGARNYGIKNTEGDYILCLDADDIIPENYIQSKYDLLIQSEMDVVYSNFVLFYPDGKRHLVNWPEYDEGLLRRSPFIHCASLYKRSMWNEVGGYDESMIHGWEDYDFWLSSAKLGYKFIKSKETNLFYRQLADSMIVDTNTKLASHIIPHLRKKHYGYYLS